MDRDAVKDILIISQARLGSSRLRRKVLLSAGGMSLIEHHIHRLAQSGLPVCIATTNSNNDEELRQFLKDRNIQMFEGDEEDVLARYYHCAKKYNAQIVVRVTSDCPLIDGVVIQQAVDQYLRLGDESVYLSNAEVRTYPRGFDFEIFSFALLEEAHLNARSQEEREHVTIYIRNNRSGRVKKVDFVRKDDASRLRVTVDTESDYHLVRRLIEEFECNKCSSEDIIELLRRSPDLVKINEHVEQAKVAGAT